MPKMLPHDIVLVSPEQGKAAKRVVGAGNQGFENRRPVILPIKCVANELPCLVWLAELQVGGCDIGRAEAFFAERFNTLRSQFGEGVPCACSPGMPDLRSIADINRFIGMEDRSGARCHVSSNP